MAAEVAGGPKVLFPYGAMYYRRPNPPPEDWERDFQTMQAHGFNMVKCWAMWNVMHTSEGEFDFSEFDGLLEVAARHGIKVVINTILDSTAPHWLWRTHPESWYQSQDGRRRHPVSDGHNVTGGARGLCLDNDPVWEQGQEFLRAIARRYKDHPSLWGYDVWNEVNSREDPPGPEALYYCYCEATSAKFRDSLRQKYGSLAALEAAWHHHFRTWDEVYPPYGRGAFPDNMDWQDFKVADRVRLLRERVQVLRSEDPVHPMISHGIGGVSRKLYDYMGDEWFWASEVDEWGITVAPGRRDNDPRNFFQMVDLVRSAARGKRIWLGELQGGHMFLTPELEGRPAGDARIATAGDISMWNWITLMTGAKGVLYWRYRPERVGPLTDFFGLCERDGSPTPRLEMAGRFARLTGGHPEIVEAQPVRGDMAILVLHESQRYANVAHARLFHAWADAIRGIYQACIDHGIQADMVELSDIGEYPLVYLPYPLMVLKENAARLREYVENGGCLVSEAGLASYSDLGFACPQLPGLGLDQVFGTEAEIVHLMPDILQDLKLNINGGAIQANGVTIQGRVGRQVLRPTTGRAIASFPDGSIAGVENSLGQGKAMLVGSYPSVAYRESQDRATGAWMAGLIEWAGQEPRLRTSAPASVARLHRRGEATYLYVLNTSHDEVQASVSLAGPSGAFRQGTSMEDSRVFPFQGNKIRVPLPAQDGMILRLD
ncbi:MAG TPA: beta-galactosidase [Chloroflexota bacterium]|nr:beta-galactosidase [Chloroflexota bacterium]